MGKTKVIIIIEGGIVQRVIHNVKDCDVTIIDCDQDGIDEGKEFYISLEINHPNQRVYVYEEDVREYSTELIDSIETQITSLLCI